MVHTNCYRLKLKILAACFFIFLLFSCMEQDVIELKYFYDYDKQYPLDTEVDSLSNNLFHIT